MCNNTRVTQHSTNLEKRSLMSLDMAVEDILVASARTLRAEQTSLEARQRALHLHQHRSHRRHHYPAAEAAAPSSRALGNSARTRASATNSLTLVLGIISNPRTPHVRTWIRSTYLSERASWHGAALVKFVAGDRGLSESDRRQLRDEARTHGDIELIDASDFSERGGIFSCIDKLFAWFRHAPRAYPHALYYAKADDDSLVDISRLTESLRPLEAAWGYGGHVQYDSFIPSEWKHCGWSSGPVGAIHRGGCPDGAEGPFPFVVGALTVMGGGLARWWSESPFVADSVRRGRLSQHEKVKHWDCGYSDVTLGYILSQSNVSVHLLSMVDAMRDRTFAEMRAERFIVAHHLRTEAHFQEAYQAMRTQDETPWTLTLRKCSDWNQVGNGLLGGNEGARPDKAPRYRHGQLRRAMRAFPRIQDWKLCILEPSLKQPLERRRGQMVSL